VPAWDVHKLEEKLAALEFEYSARLKFPSLYTLMLKVDKQERERRKRIVGEKNRGLF
jgi:hypothetical protein